MLDVKAWLETTGYKVAENRFVKPPPLPYIVFTERREVRGADYGNGIADRDIALELYSGVIDPVAESAVEGLLNNRAVEYSKERDWIPTESFFQTLYAFGMTEKL